MARPVVPSFARPFRVQRISHDPIRGAQAFTELTAPIITDSGTRIPGLRFADPRVHALLQALLVHRLLPNGFTIMDLRAFVATLLGATIEDISAGKMTYDLRRLRVHGLIERIPKSRRYQALPRPGPDPGRIRMRPWLVQMGTDRGGWYGWDRLDNFGGRSADRLHPDWQRIRIGDRLAAWSDGSEWWQVA